jgi:serine O-acetyltransferase
MVRGGRDVVESVRHEAQPRSGFVRTAKAPDGSAPSDPVNATKPAQRSIEGPKAMMREVYSRQPPFVNAVLADARIAAAYRDERHEFSSRLDGVLQGLRLMLRTDAFFALTAYRMKTRLQALGIPVLPWIAHHLAIASGQVSIADGAVVHPGVFIPNGQVVIYGLVEIGPGVTLLPWVTVGPIAGGFIGPKIGPGALIGTGAKVLGDIEIGAGARIGTNAVVLDDVPPNTTVVGMPAQAVTE